MSFSQKKGIDFYKIQTNREVGQYLAENHAAEIVTINEAYDTNEIYLPLYRQKLGFIFNFGKTYFKIVRIDSTLSFGVSFMFINAAKYSKLQIDSIRKAIIEEYKAGTNFSTLMQQHSKDGSIVGNRSVDDNPRWLSHATMLKEFETAVRNHKKGDIFTIDVTEPKIYVAEQNWYFVALRTFDDTFIKRLDLLKTTIIKPSLGQ